jgi:mRNA-degrading endonuclease HigB of HigAB toxin-antitoxin module
MMNLFGEKRLDKFATKHAQFRTLIKALKAIVAEAAWKGQHDIPAAFATAQKGTKVLFRFGQSCRILADIEYATDHRIAELVEKQEPIETVGTVIICQTWTHEEYNKQLGAWWK